MKGLLRKDVYQMWKYYKIYYVLAIIMEIASILASGNLFLAVYPLVLMCMVPSNMQTVDESGKWELYCGTLPCTRKQVVTGKYLIGPMIAFPVLVLVAVCQCLQMGLAGNFTWGSLRDVLLVCLTMVLLMPSISLPLMFKFGATKSKMVQFVVLGIFIAVVIIWTLLMNQSNPYLPDLSGGVLPVLVMAVVYLLSWRLSVRFYEKRDLG